MSRLTRHFKLLRRALYLLPIYQILVVRMRFFYFVRLRRKLRTLDSEFAFKNTIMNNLKGLKHYNGRTDALIRPLSVIETINEESELLIIGPRNEHDLFSAIGHGFGRNRVRGLDLISYSPMVDLGDMHRTSYPDDNFDAIIVGWTLSYSRDPELFAKELLRIVRDGGLIGIGVEYSTLTNEDSIALSGYAIQEREYVSERINSTGQILDLFGPRVKTVFFQHDAPLKRTHTRAGMIDRVSQVLVIFSVTKVEVVPVQA
jgi:hypothetical protein